MTRPSFQIADAQWLGPDDGMPEAIRFSNERDLAIDMGPTIAFPGLVNSHEHLEFNCYPALGTPPYSDFLDWSAAVHRDHGALVADVECVPWMARVEVGLLKNLLSGVTSVVHHGRQLPEDPSRPIRIISNFDIVHSPELDSRGPQEFLKGWRRRPIVAHLAEATTAASRRRALALLRWNIFRRRVIGVHGVALSGSDFRKLDALVWCPASNLFLLGRTADVATAHGETTILFGSDSTLSAPGTFWDHVRLARDLRNLSDAELFGALTADAQRFWNPTNGEIDFVIARRRADDPWAAFFATTPNDILLVVSRNRIVLADEAIIQVRPDLVQSLAPVTVGSTRKFVAMDIEALRYAFADRGPSLDVEDMINRLAGTAQP